MADEQEYEVLQDIELDGATYKVGERIALNKDAAEPLVAEGKIALAKDEGADE